MCRTTVRACLCIDWCLLSYLQLATPYPSFSLQALLSCLLEQPVSLNSNKASLLEGRKVVKKFLLILVFCVCILSRIFSGNPSKWVPFISYISILFLSPSRLPHKTDQPNKNLKHFRQGQPEVYKWQLVVVAVGSVLSYNSGVWLYSLLVFSLFHLFFL